MISSKRPTMCWGSTRRAGRAGTATPTKICFDPFVLFGYLAGVAPKLGFSTGVLILAQRQTVLVAKQAACLDVLCGGRFRLGIGVGWNEVEYVGLNENFHNRGRRSEQVQVMQQLWAEPHVKYDGRWHHIDDAGINPRPASGKVPVWFGGHHGSAPCRASPNGATAGCQTPIRPTRRARRVRPAPPAAGKPGDPADIGIEVWTSMGSGSEADWNREAKFWKAAGVSHICLTTTFDRRPSPPPRGPHLVRPHRRAEALPAAVADAL